MGKEPVTAALERDRVQQHGNESTQ